MLGTVMTVPSSIERLVHFPDVAVALLHRIPSQPAEMPDFRDLLEEHSHIVAELAQVAIQSGHQLNGEKKRDAQSLFEQVGSTALAEMTITLLVRDYMRRAFAASEDRRYWRYTMACAVCCEQVASPGQESALLSYASGLLHDIGRLALIATYPDRYSNLLTLTDRMFASNQSFDMLEHERLLFGMDHFAAGEWLATTWKMPSWLRSIVGKFDQATGEHAKLVATIRGGTRLAHSMGFGYLQAAPRADIRKIVDQLPYIRKQWQALPDWNHGEMQMREKVLARLTWYAKPAAL
jgi:HD-like signal output (HDOD) protein